MIDDKTLTWGNGNLDDKVWTIRLHYTCMKISFYDRWFNPELKTPQHNETLLSQHSLVNNSKLIVQHKVTASHVILFPSHLTAWRANRQRKAFQDGARSVAYLNFPNEMTWNRRVFVNNDGQFALRIFYLLCCNLWFMQKIRLKQNKQIETVWIY